MTEQEWLGKDNQLGISIWNTKYRINQESLEDFFDRVSNNSDVVKEILKSKKACFGGRILANLNNSKGGSTANCYSRGFVEDSLQDIMKVNTDIVMTFKYEGGQGISLSKIRPKGAMIKGTYESEGIIPFMKIFDVSTKGIIQGGKRRGALLMSLDIWHKDAMDFIKIKSDLKEINNANLSLEIDDEFMSYVSKYYTTGENTVKHIKRIYGNTVVEYDVDVIKLYKILCEYACKYAEPGILFVNPYRNYILQQYHPTYKIETGNACSEQSLPKHGACNLCSINLYEMVKNRFTDKAYFDFNELKRVTEVMVEAMDDIVDLNMENHPLQEQKEVSFNFRNIGIGFMGLADAMLALGYTYGDNNSIEFTYNIMHKMFRAALFKSVELGKAKGSFPAYNKCVWDSEIIKTNFSTEDIQYLKKMDCLRNAELMSIAPTGSIATMFGVSTGIEPNFRLSYTRRSPSLGKDGKDAFFKVNIQPVDEYYSVNNTNILPKYFVDSSQVFWLNRIKVQAAAQISCDTACSSTCNLPKSTDVKEVEQIYLEAWKHKLKGFTIYRDGSRDSILFDDNSNINNTTLIQNTAPKRPEKLDADFYSVKVKGEQFIVLIGLLDHKPYEIFAFKPNMILNLDSHTGTIIKKSKMHYSFVSELLEIPNLESVNDDIEEKAATLYSSMLLRHGVPIKYILKTAKKVNNNITSFSSAMCRVLSKYINNDISSEKCPECGGIIIKEGGCEHCQDCGYSRCG